MTVPVFKTLVGIIDGSNTLFETPTSYKPGTVRVFINGMVSLDGMNDGWVELGNKKILLKEPPRETDIVRAYYVNYT